MAKQITPLKNSKLGSNSKTLAGSNYLTVVRTGEGKECLPYVDTVDLSSSTKTTMTTHTSNISTLQEDVSIIKTIQNFADSKNTKAEFMVFNLDLSIASGGTQTLEITVVDVVNLKKGTGYVQPTIVSTDATLGKNNRFLVDKFMTTDHARYIVQATCEDGAGFNYTDLQEEIDVQVSSLASDAFYFRIVNKKGIPLTNLKLAKMGILTLKFEITGTKR